MDDNQALFISLSFWVLYPYRFSDFTYKCFVPNTIHIQNLYINTLLSSFNNILT